MDTRITTFTSKLLDWGVPVERACFLAGVRSAIDSLRDLEEKGVPATYMDIHYELVLTLDKMINAENT